jgi:hypothetical protein
MSYLNEKRIKMEDNNFNQNNNEPVTNNAPGPEQTQNNGEVVQNYEPIQNNNEPVTNNPPVSEQTQNNGEEVQNNEPIQNNIESVTPMNNSNNVGCISR